MKVLITSDLQFSEQVRLSHRTEEGLTTRLLDQVRCFDWIIETGKRLKCEKLLVLGDVFDSRTAIPVAVIDQACRCFKRAHAAFSDVYEMVGNHDAALRHARINSLQAMSGLATVIERPTVIDSFAFVPWVDDPDDFRAAVSQLARNRKAYYLFAHVLIVGAVPAFVGRSLSDLHPARWKRVFLGDVHDPIQLAKRVQYVGAPMQHHYGDAGGTRGVWTLDTMSGEAKFIENTLSPRFHVVDTVKMRGVRKGDFVRVRVEDAVQARAIAAVASKLTPNVENESVELESSVQPRLPVGSSDSFRSILRRYVKHKRPDVDRKRLVDVGLSILDEVQG